MMNEVEEENEVESTSWQDVHTIELDIENFEELTDGDIIQIANTLMSEMENIRIITIEILCHHRIRVYFKIFKNEEEEENIQREITREFLEEQQENLHEIASNIHFENCKEIKNLLGKSVRMKKTDTKMNEYDNCNVCFEEYKENDYIRVLPHCKHHFHKRCIDKWLKKKAQCAVCRNNVFEEQIKKVIDEKAKELGIQLKES